MSQKTIPFREREFSPEKLVCSYRKEGPSMVKFHVGFEVLRIAVKKISAFWYSHGTVWPSIQGDRTSPICGSLKMHESLNFRLDCAANPHVSSV
jgi:hypothetical protein